MTITWILFASTSLLIQRYYKHLPFSIQLHVALGISIPLLSFAALMTILFGYANNSWPIWSYPLAHSIFGIVAIGFSFLQVSEIFS